MFNRLKKELTEFLQEYNISFDMDFFSNEVLELAGVKVDPAYSHYNFGFSELYNSGSINEFSFRVPNVTLSEAELIANYLEAPKDKCKIAECFPVSVEMVFGKIIEQFKARIKQYALEQSEKIHKQIAASQVNLEKQATLILKTRLTELFQCLKMQAIATADSQSLKNLVLQALGAFSQLQAGADNFTDVLACEEPLRQFFAKNPTLQQEEQTYAALNNVLTAFAEYRKFNRAEARLTVKKFQTEIEAFVNQYQISVSSCDIFEETILKLAGITTAPLKCVYGTNQYGDKSRMFVKVIGISVAQAQALHDYFKNIGDATAKLNPVFEVDKNTLNNNDNFARGQRAHLGDDEERSGYFMPASASGGRYQSVAAKAKPKPVEMVKGFCFEVAGDTLYRLIFPLFKEKITQFANESGMPQLSSYQAQSVYFLTKRKIDQLIENITDLRSKLNSDALIKRLTPAQQGKLEALLNALSKMNNEIHTATDVKNEKYVSDLMDALQTFKRELHVLADLPKDFKDQARQIQDGVVRYLQTLAPEQTLTLQAQGVSELSLFGTANNAPEVIKQHEEFHLTLLPGSTG